MPTNIAEQIRLDITDPKYLKDITDSEFFGFPAQPLLEAEAALLAKDRPSIAYFSMEYGLAPSIYQTFKTVNPVRSPTSSPSTRSSPT